MNTRTTKRSTKESIRKPYRSSAATYTDYKNEIPDGDYYGLKHSEFKKPWLPASGYDEMEYKWDFPLEYLNPIHVDFETPDMGKYNFPGAQPVNPNWNPPNWNPQYPLPDYPASKPEARKKPGTKGGTQIVWTYCEGQDFEFCPGETVAVQFTEYTTDRIESVDAGEGEIIPPARGKLGESKHRPGYPEGTYTVMVRIPEAAGMEYNVTSTTKSGETCVSHGTQRQNCLDPCGEMSIGYTSAQMMTGTSQTLTVQNGDPHSVYRYELSGGGTLKDTGNGTMQYTAPDTNPNCENNPTITVRDKRTGTVCATLKIGVGDPASYYGVAYIIYQPCAVLVGPLPRLCPQMGDMLLGSRYCSDPYQAYNCDGTKAEPGFLNPALVCGVQSSAVYTDPLMDLYYMARCESLHKYSGTVDLRTSDQKLSGCCPAALA
jgi:hypothetical protein